MEKHSVVPGILDIGCRIENVNAQENSHSHEHWMSPAEKVYGLGKISIDLAGNYDINKIIIAVVFKQRDNTTYGEVSCLG